MIDDKNGRKNIESRIKGQKAVTWEIFYVAA